MKGRQFVVGIFLSAVLAGLPAYLRAVTVNSPWDAPSLNLGDTAIVNKAAYSFRFPYSSWELFETGQPQRGDLVQTRLPGGDDTGFERVLGLPGETVEVRESQVLVNGRALPLRPLARARFLWVPVENQLGAAVADEDGHWITFTPGSGGYRTPAPVQLTATQYFLLGDNREGSDGFGNSRVWGAVQRDRILGKVVGVLRDTPAP